MAYLESGSGEKILLHDPRASEPYSCEQTCLKGRLFITGGNDSIYGNPVYYNCSSDQRDFTGVRSQASAAKERGAKEKKKTKTANPGSKIQPGWLMHDDNATRATTRF